MKRGDESYVFEEEKKKKMRERGGEHMLMKLDCKVGPIWLSKITKMPHNLVFHNLKTPKICFQFPQLITQKSEN